SAANIAGSRAFSFSGRGNLTSATPSVIVTCTRSDMGWISRVAGGASRAGRFSVLVWGARRGAGDCAARPQPLEDERHQRDRDDAEDDGLEVLLDDWDATEPVSREHEPEDPYPAAGDVPHGEARVGHLADPGDERRERAHDGHEP